MSRPQGLTAIEAEAWARVAATVVPMHVRQAPNGETGAAAKSDSPRVVTPAKVATPSARVPIPAASPRGSSAGEQTGLDSHWDRRLKGGTLTPDITLDLHEHSLDAAYQRLLGGLDMARETGARVVLIIAGRERAAASADRAVQRGAIRAKLLDWLAASRHANAIAAIRAAHRRHGGDGALYVILKKAR